MLIDESSLQQQFLILASASQELPQFLFNTPTKENLFRSNYLGQSWEGFALEEIIRHLNADEEECYFWAVHNEAELDLLIIKSGKKIGFEFKFSETPKFTKSMRVACELLELDELYLIVPGHDHFILQEHKCFVNGLEYFLKNTLSHIYKERV